MSRKTEQMYQALELPYGASADEVKKAYFRLVRKYNPEQEPEKFQEIRAAYETLKDGPPREEDETDTSWISWKYPMTGYLIEQADDFAEAEDYASAVHVLEDAELMEPANPLINLLMARYLHREEHWQKAAKHAEKVTQRLPKNREAWMILANALFHRGWYKKALPAFEKLHRMGVRDIPILVAYSQVLDRCELHPKARKIRQEIFSIPDWDKGSLEETLFLYHDLAEYMPADPKSVSELLDQYDHFALRHKKDQHKDLLITPLLVMTHDDSEMIKCGPACGRIQQSMKLQAEKSIASKELVRSVLLNMTLSMLDVEERNLSSHWRPLVTCTAIDEDEREFQQFIIWDTQLCLLKEKERTLEEMPIILRDYDFLAEEYADFFTRLQQEDPEAIYQDILWQYRKICHKYGGRFEKLYPEDMPRTGKRKTVQFDPMDDEDWDEEAEWWAPQEPFVREQEKVGRNDPCPCGSGKKFKKCCMGKGIYD